ncbi:Uncharacterised protein [Vibrio cholerae]|nr:Uncharacterised protein [Vibrio cholerae]
MIHQLFHITGKVNRRGRLLRFLSWHKRFQYL